jgi:sulfate adenylyltransferase subunit 2
MGEHFRVFPISNWTELDVWSYIALEKIPMPSLYFSHKREVLIRDGVILGDSEIIEKLPGEKAVEKIVRFRTIGDMTCTGGVESPASSIEEIIAEIASTRTTERGGPGRR